MGHGVCRLLMYPENFKIFYSADCEEKCGLRRGRNLVIRSLDSTYLEMHEKSEVKFN